MEFHTERNLQEKNQLVAVFHIRCEMKTLEELAFQALIHNLRHICSEINMDNVSYLHQNLRSLSFAEHESLWTLPLLQELTTFTFDTLHYKLAHKILDDTVNFFHSIKNVAADENFMRKFLNTVKEKFKLLASKSVIEYNDKYAKKDIYLYTQQFINADELAIYLRSVLKEFTRMNTQGSEYDMNSCLEHQKVCFQFLGVRKLCAHIITACQDAIIHNNVNATKFLLIEKLYESIPEKFCDIISSFVNAGLYKTRTEYVYCALKQALNENLPPKMFAEVTDLIYEAASSNIPFAAKTKLVSLLNPETCRNLVLSDLELASLVKVRDFTKLEVLAFHDCYLNDFHGIQYLKCLKCLKITSSHRNFSDKLSDLKCPINLEEIILDGIVGNKDILINLFSWTPHLKRLDISVRIPEGYVHIGQQLTELEELKMAYHYQKYKITFLLLPGGMKLTCNCIWSRWLSNLNCQISPSISELCFKALTYDIPLNGQLSGLHVITLFQTLLKCQDLFINMGRQLTSLILENCVSVDLDHLAAHCPYLLKLKLVFCKFDNYDHSSCTQFPHLKAAYIDPICTPYFCGWCLIAYSTKLEEIVALRPYNNIECFDNFIHANPLSQLKRFETRVDNENWLTGEQAQKLVDKCKCFKVVKHVDLKEEKIQIQ